MDYQEQRKTKSNGKKSLADKKNQPLKRIAVVTNLNIALHTKIKHRILAYYYGIIQQMFKDRKTPPYSWYYADLFSGDGICTCEEIPSHVIDLLPTKEEREYNAPFFTLLDSAKAANFPLACYFNDTDEKRITVLKEKLKPYPNIILIGNEDANGFHKKVLKSIGQNNTNRPGLFLLDPSNHGQLKFSTIKEISEFKDERSGRMPELIINLMTYSMLMAIQRHREKDYDSITESLGTDVWKKDLVEYQRRGKTHELFKDVFLEQLKSLGYRTSCYGVASVVNAPQYYLIFATYNDAIFRIHKGMEKYIKQLQEEKWVRKIAIINKLTEVPKGQSRLSSFA